jgi:hypothetical protein
MYQPYVPYRQRERLGKFGPISEVSPLQNGILQVTCKDGNYFTVDLKPYFHSPRLYALQEPNVWQDVNTNGRFVHWLRDGTEVAELAWDELIQFLVGEQWF